MEPGLTRRNRAVEETGAAVPLPGFNLTLGGSVDILGAEGQQGDSLRR